MPFLVAFDGPLMRISGAGTLTNQDLADLFREIIRIEKQLGHAPHRVIDLTSFERLDLGFTDVDAAVRTRTTNLPPNTYRAALVARHPVQFGLARMYQSLSIHPRIESNIFDDLGQATAWASAGDPPPA